MMNFSKIFVILIMILTYSCDDNLSNEIKSVKDNQNLIMQKQSDIIKKLTLIDAKVGKINTASNNNKPSDKKNTNKRKTPNPNFVHNIEIGNSVVLGNVDAKVTVTKFTDFQ